MRGFERERLAAVLSGNDPSPKRSEDGAAPPSNCGQASDGTILAFRKSFTRFEMTEPVGVRNLRRFEFGANDGRSRRALSSGCGTR